MKTKLCFKCGKCLCISEFYRHQGMADGYLGKCKECARKDVRERRVLCIDYYREYDKARYSAGEHTIFRDEYKKSATKKLWAAVKRGKVIKSACTVCGSIEDVQGHHEDYEKPLDVVWLCRKHHMELHRVLDSNTEHDVARKKTPKGKTG